MQLTGIAEDLLCAKRSTSSCGQGDLLVAEEKRSGIEIIQETDAEGERGEVTGRKGICSQSQPMLLLSPS